MSEHVYFNSTRGHDVGARREPSFGDGNPDTSRPNDGERMCIIPSVPVAKSDLRTLCRESSRRPNVTRASLKLSQFANAAFDVFAGVICFLVVLLTVLSFPLGLFLLFFVGL